MNIKNLVIPIIISSVIIIATAGVFYFEDTLKTIIGCPLTVLIEILGLFLLAVSPIIHGLITRNKVGSVMIGVIPVLGFYIYIDLSSIISGDFTNMDTLVYFGVLAFIGGLEGYFAAIEKIEHNLLAVCCFLFWVVFFMRGFID